MTSENAEQEPITGDVREAAGNVQPPPGSDDAAVVEEAVAPEVDELAERTADLQRLQAEYTNYRRRVERDRQSVIDTAKASVVGELLGVLEDLDRARTHGDLESGPFKVVADKLTGTLTNLGLSEFGAEGDAFDPSLHEAVQHEGEGHDPVLGAVLRKGYKFGDRVLRHAMVAVTDRVDGTDATDAPAPAAESEQE